MVKLVKSASSIHVQNCHKTLYEIFLPKTLDLLKSVTRSSFLSKSVVIFVVVILKMATLFERNEDGVTGFFK